MLRLLSTASDLSRSIQISQYFIDPMPYLQVNDARAFRLPAMLQPRRRAADYLRIVFLCLEADLLRGWLLWALKIIKHAASLLESPSDSDALLSMVLVMAFELRLIVFSTRCH